MQFWLERGSSEGGISGRLTICFAFAAPLPPAFLDALTPHMGGPACGLVWAGVEPRDVRPGVHRSLADGLARWVPSQEGEGKPVVVGRVAYQEGGRKLAPAVLETAPRLQDMKVCSQAILQAGRICRQTTLQMGRVCRQAISKLRSKHSRPLLPDGPLCLAIVVAARS